MSTYILTSMFHNGFNDKATKVFRQEIAGCKSLAFIASEFENGYEKTDYYFRFFLKMFEDINIHFKKAYVVDGRMTIGEIQKAVSEADVIWLSGGDTPTQFAYFQKYGLDKIIKQHNGVVIGMSAGSINLAETSICTLACGHYKQEIYHGLGCVNISVEPHFVRSRLSKEVVELSNTYVIYGLCDESLIVCKMKKIEFIGEVYKINHGKIVQIN